MKKRILITNWKEAKKTQLELFNQGYKWFNDVCLIEEKDLMLKSRRMIYPIFINLEENKMLSWSSNHDLNLNPTLKKEFRKEKLKRLNESTM